MDLYGYEFVRESDLQHYGLKGMHWGTRRWQNPDGTFNAAGYQRYFGRGTGEDYHPVGRSSSGGHGAGTSRSSSNSGGTNRSFDKEKAKKIAKGVAIGAAVVGGAVLVAYGGKKIHDLGGINKLASDAVQRHRDVKLENLRLKNEFKTEKAKLVEAGKNEAFKAHADAKLKRMRMLNEAKEAQIQFRENAKAAREQLAANAKENAKLKALDPDGNFEKGALLKELRKGTSESELKNKLASLDSQEKLLFNKGIVSAKDLEGRRNLSDTEFLARNNNPYDIWTSKLARGEITPKPAGLATSRSTASTAGEMAKKAYKAATSEQAKQTYKNVAKTAGETAKKAYKAVTSEQAKEGYKKAAQTTGQVAKKAYKAATSEQTKNAVKKTAVATKNGVKTAASITKSTIEVAKLASQHPQETKAAVDYTKQLLQNMQGISAANARNGQAVSRSNATEQYNAQALARQYRRDHPNTKLSNREIVRNMGYGL